MTIKQKKLNFIGVVATFLICVCCSEDETPLNIPEDVVIFEDGSSRYKVVRSEKANHAIIFTAPNYFF